MVFRIKAGLRAVSSLQRMMSTISGAGIVESKLRGTPPPGDVASTTMPASSNLKLDTGKDVEEEEIQYANSLVSQIYTWLVARWMETAEGIVPLSSVKLSEIKDKFPTIGLIHLERACESLKDAGKLEQPEGRSRIVFFNLNIDKAREAASAILSQQQVAQSKPTKDNKHHQDGSNKTGSSNKGDKGGDRENKKENSNTSTKRDSTGQNINISNTNNGIGNGHSGANGHSGGHTKATHRKENKRRKDRPTIDTTKSGIGHETPHIYTFGDGDDQNDFDALFPPFPTDSFDEGGEFLDGGTYAFQGKKRRQVGDDNDLGITTTLSGISTISDLSPMHHDATEFSFLSVSLIPDRGNPPPSLDIVKEVLSAAFDSGNDEILLELIRDRVMEKGVVSDEFQKSIEWLAEKNNIMIDEGLIYKI